MWGSKILYSNAEGHLIVPHDTSCIQEHYMYIYTKIYICSNQNTYIYIYIHRHDFALVGFPRESPNGYACFGKFVLTKAKYFF